MKIVLQGHIVVPHEELQFVHRQLDEHIRLTRNEAGCLRFEVTPDELEPNRFNVYEEFVDRAAFDRHQVRVRQSDWGRATSNVERHYEVREIE